MDSHASPEPIITLESPSSALAQDLLRRYYDELEVRFPDGFDVAESSSPSPEHLRAPRGAFLVAWLDNRAVGCGALRSLGDGIGEIKRMWLDPSVRGRGLGRAMLAALERSAYDLGFTRLRLDTAAQLVEAIALYRSSGFREIERYNDNSYAAIWFEKPLT